MDRSDRYSGLASQMSRLCGGVSGPGDRHRDHLADRNVPAGCPDNIMRGLIGFCRCQTIQRSAFSVHRSAFGGAIKTGILLAAKVGSRPGLLFPDPDEPSKC